MPKTLQMEFKKKLLKYGISKFTEIWIIWVGTQRIVEEASWKKASSQVYWSSHLSLIWKHNSVTFLLNLLKLELKQNLITCRQVRGNSKNGYNCYEKRNRYNKICEDICLLYTYWDLLQTKLTKKKDL